MTRKQKRNQYNCTNLLLNPKLTSQQTQINKAVQVWIPLYKFERVLTNSNYIVRKVGTIFTQCVDRIRLRPVKQPDDLQDLEAIDPQQFVPDSTLRDDKQEPEVFDRHVEDLIFPQPAQARVPIITPPPPENTGGHPRLNNDSSSEEDQEAENTVQPATKISNPVVGSPNSDDEPNRVGEQHQTRRQSQRIRNQHQLNQQALTTQAPKRVSFSTQVLRRRTLHLQMQLLAHTNHLKPHRPAVLTQH